MNQTTRTMPPPPGSLNADQALQQEYDEFVYAVSHDLRAPLRHIEGFSKILLKRHADTFDEKSRRDFEFVIEGVQRCKSIIDSLQALAQVRPGAQQPVDPARSLDRAKASLASLIAETGAKVQHEPLPELVGDETHFYTLFRALVENALRYRHPDRRPKVHVTATLQQHVATFCVEDNGIGIPLPHQESVFKIFHRGGRRDGSPGEGVGLTLARKIVHLYSGHIWVDTTDAMGTRICFTITTPNDG